MPEPVSDLPGVAGIRSAATGFCGKLPARGDFVASALPRRFVEPWHDWMQRMLAGSRRLFGEDWLAAWLEAPIWRFALSPGLCGPDAAVGLWMPSVDRVGRYFALTFAAVMPGGDPRTLLCQAGRFLAVAETAGLDAVASDLAPDQLAARLATAGSGEPGDCGTDPQLCPPGGALWWSEGSDRVPRTVFATPALPDVAEFSGMLDTSIPAREP